MNNPVVIIEGGEEMSGHAGRLMKAARYLRMRPLAAATLARGLVHNAIGSTLTLFGVRRVACILCGWEGARFAAHPDGHRLKLGQRCPACASSPRYRMFARYLKSRPELSDPQSVLVEFAPEPCLMSWLRREYPGTYVTADLESPLAGVRVDLTSCGLRSGCADVILCSHVLEHLPDDMAGLAELKRVLKAGAWCILQVPLVAGQAKTLEYGRPNPLEHDHFRRYGEDFLERIRAAGLRVEAIETGSFASVEEVARLGLPPVPILIAVKPA